MYPPDRQSVWSGRDCPRCEYLYNDEPITIFGFGCSVSILIVVFSLLFTFLAPWVGLAVLGGFTALFALEWVCYRLAGHLPECAVKHAYSYSFGLVRYLAAAAGGVG